MRVTFRPDELETVFNAVWHETERLARRRGLPLAPLLVVTTGDEPEQGPITVDHSDEEVELIIEILSMESGTRARNLQSKLHARLERERRTRPTLTVVREESAS